MKITEKKLRQIIQEEVNGVLTEAYGDYYDYAGKKPDRNRWKKSAMKKHKHPWHKDPAAAQEVMDAAETVYWQWEVSSPTRFKTDMEDQDHFGGLPEMPVEFYADLVKAIKKDDRAWQKYQRTAYTPGWRD